MERPTQERTALVVARQLWHWGGWIPSFAIGVAAKQLLARAGGSEVVEATIEAAGVFLLTGGICLFLTWSAYHMWRHSAPQRFRRLEEGLIIADNQLHSYGRNPEDISGIRFVIRSLDKLRIPHPGAEGQAKDWQMFLGRIVGEARAGAVKEARLVWSQIKRQGELANEADT